MVATLLLCALTGSALPIASPRIVEFDLHKAAKQGSDLVKISGSSAPELVEAQLVNEQYYYQIELEIGTPPQKVDFTIDTGSSDLWVMSANNPYCTTDPTNTTGINCTGSVFAPEDSKTFKHLNTSFSIVYGDHSMANGTLAKDTIRLGEGSPALKDAIFAVADVVNSSTCVFGVGFNGNEAGAHLYRNGSGVWPTYYNVPTLMKEQGMISTNAYSLWLNDVNAESGSILFGGVDRAKYDGNLWVIPVYNNYHKYTDRPIQTRVMLDSITADGLPLADFSIAVLLDSGTSFSYLPPELMHAMGRAVGFIYDEDLGYYFGSSSKAFSNVKNFYLSFSGAIIEVPISNLLVDITESDGTTPLIINGEPQSILAVGEADDDYMYILGDVFLRSMYAVFDIDHYEIGLANAKLNVTDSDIVMIEASIPGAIQAPLYTQTKANNASYSIHPFTPAYPPASTLTINIESMTAVVTATGQPTPIPTKARCS